MSMDNSSRAHRTKRRPALKISFDEEPALSESDDEDKFYPTALHVNFPLKKKVGVKKTVQCKSVQCNIEPNKSAKLMTDQDLRFPCGQCMCCKKMGEFLKPLSSTDYDSGQGPSGIQGSTKGKNIVNKQGHSSPNVNIISCKTLIPLTKSKQVDYWDKYCNFDIPNIAENESETLTNKSCNKTESSLDSSSTVMASGQYYDVSNTAAGFEKTQDEIPETNILPSAQSKIIPQQLDNSVEGQKKEKMKQKCRILLGSGKGRQPKKSINTYTHSSTDKLELSTTTGKKNDTDGRTNLNIINEKMKYKSKLITNTQDTTDFQLNGKGAKAKIGNFRSELSSPDFQKENESDKDVVDNGRLMSTGKKHRKTINKVMDDLSSDNQIEQEDFFAMPSMKRPKKSALDFASSQNQSLLKENILKEENVLESIKKRQKGRPKKLQCTSNDNEKQLGSSAGFDYSSLNQSNDNITPTTDCNLRRSKRTPKPVISFLADSLSVADGHLRSFDAQRSRTLYTIHERLFLKFKWF